MFPLLNRFTTRLNDDFFKNAKRVYSPLFVLYFVNRKDDKKAKATVIIPKKKVPLAVQRTQLKRKMKAALSPFLKDLNGFDLVLYLKTKTTAKEVETQEMEKQVGKMIRKIKKNEGFKQ